MSISMSRVFLTPQLASEWNNIPLGYTRPLSKPTVEKYSRVMVNGDWKENGECIGFFEDGTRANGNHRINAVIKAGESLTFQGIWTGVQYGIPLDAKHSIDHVKSRSFIDYLHQDPLFKNKTVLGAVTKWAYSWELGVRENKGPHASPDVSEHITFLNNHPELHEAAEKGKHYNNIFPLPRAVTPTVFGMSWYLLSRINRQQAEEFLNALCDGTKNESLQITPVLQRRLLKEYQEKDSDSSRKLALVNLAWNYYRTGKKVDRLQLPFSENSSGKRILKNSDFPVPI